MPHPQEVYIDDTDAAGGDEASVAAKESKCRDLINQQSGPDALKIALADPPMGGNEAVKNKAFKVVMDVVSSIKSSEIKKTVASLSPVRAW